MPESNLYVVTQVREVQIKARSAADAMKAARRGFDLARGRQMGVQEVSCKVEKVR